MLYRDIGSREHVSSFTIQVVMLSSQLLNTESADSSSLTAFVQEVGLLKGMPLFAYTRVLPCISTFIGLVVLMQICGIGFVLI